MGTRASRKTSTSEWPWICKVYSWSPRDSKRILEAVMGVNRRLRGRAWNYVQILDIFLTLSSASALNSCLCFHPHCHLVYFQCSSYSESEPYSSFPISLNVEARFLARLFKALHSLAPFTSPVSFAVPLLLAHCLPATLVSLLLPHCAGVLPRRAFAQATPSPGCSSPRHLLGGFLTPFSNICSNLTFSTRTSLTSFPIAIFPTSAGHSGFSFL